MRKTLLRLAAMSGFECSLSRFGGGLGGATNYPISVRRPCRPDPRPDPVQARCGTTRRSRGCAPESTPSAVGTSSRAPSAARSAAAVR